MSRSFKHNAYIGNTCAKSEKRDKRFANRRFRAKMKSMVKRDDNYRMRMREIVNRWDFAKDGKQLIDEDDPLYDKSRRK